MQAAYYAHIPVRILTREHPSIKYYSRHDPSKHGLIWECATNIIGVTNPSKQAMIESDSCLREKVINNAFLCAQRYDIKNHIQRLEEFYVCELQKSRK